MDEWILNDAASLVGLGPGRLELRLERATRWPPGATRAQATGKTKPSEIKERSMTTIP